MSKQKLLTTIDNIPAFIIRETGKKDVVLYQFKSMSEFMNRPVEEVKEIIRKKELLI